MQTTTRMLPAIQQSTSEKLTPSRQQAQKIDLTNVYLAAHFRWKSSICRATICINFSVRLLAKTTFGSASASFLPNSSNNTRREAAWSVAMRSNSSRRDARACHGKPSRTRLAKNSDKA
jgi:hypothetical protein